EHLALVGRGAAGGRHRRAVAGGERDGARPGADVVERVEVDVDGGLLPHVRGKLGAVAGAAPVGDEWRAEVAVAEKGRGAGGVGVGTARSEGANDGDSDADRRSGARAGAR